MTHPVRRGGQTYAPPARNGLSDPRSTGGPPAPGQRPSLNDSRSTR